MVEKIVSGGQAGVDRAALDAAMAAGLEVGGWCPKGRRAEDSPIPDRYPLTETKCNKYRTRTRWNVRDSDATLILCEGEPSGGTALTIQFCEQLNKPFMIISPSSTDFKAVNEWLLSQQVKVLNVAGPRERIDAQIYDISLQWLSRLICKMAK